MVLVRGSPPYFEPAANPAAVMSFTSYSPGPEMTKGLLVPRRKRSFPRVATIHIGVIQRNEDNIRTKVHGLEIFEPLETGPKTKVVSPACARTHAPSWNVKITCTV